MSQPSANYVPTTFLERGASVPFTTPALAAARVRPAERLGLELIVANPSGGRGAYVLPWTDLRSFCRPTVHDVQLIEAIAGLPSVTPGTIRTAARQIATDGHAGRAASAAASAALAAEEENRVFTNFHLLLHLVQQEEPPGASAIPPERESQQDLKARARRTIAVLAPRLRVETATLAANLEELSTLFSPIGLGARQTHARLPHAIAALTRLQQEIEAFAAGNGNEETVADLAGMVSKTAALSLTCAGHAMREARKSAASVLALLVAWQADPVAIGRQLAQPDWLLDGWERICRLWSLSDDPVDQRAALDEIAALLPIIPREAGDWVDFHVEMDAPLRTHRLVLGHEDWRTGCCVQDTIARNEALLAA